MVKLSNCSSKNTNSTAKHLVPTLRGGVSGMSWCDKTYGRDIIVDVAELHFGSIMTSRKSSLNPYMLREYDSILADDYGKDIPKWVNQAHEDIRGEYA